MTEDSIRQFLQNLETPAFPARRYLAGDALPAITGFLHDADRRGNSVHLAIYEFNDHELVDALKVFGERGHVLLGNGGATQPWVAQELTAAGLEVHHRDLSHSGKSSPSVHNKFLVESDATGKATRVLTGSTNWTTTGLCTQLNNVLIVERPVIAGRFLDQWNKLVAAGDDMTPDLKASNSQPTNDQELSLFFAATNNEAEFKPVLDLIAGARQGALFLMFMPGQSPLLEALLDRAQQNDIYVRGVVSSINAPKADGQMGSVAGEVVKSGADAQSFHKDVPVPVGISDKDKPSFQETEFTVGEIKAAHLMAIVHSKAIVIDPFSKDCAVITGSHNFSVSASGKNDENLVIIRGNQALAQAYALHINGVYDHYSWRAFLASGGDADQVFKPLDGWKSGGSRAQELAFWMGGPVPPQNGSGKASPKSAPAKPPARGSKSPAPGGNGRKKPKPVSAPAAVRNAAAAKAKTTKAKATQTRAKTPTKRQPAKTKTKPPTKRQAPKAKSPVKRKSVPKASPGRAKKK